MWGAPDLGLGITLLLRPQFSGHVPEHAGAHPHYFLPYPHLLAAAPLDLTFVFQISKEPEGHK